MKLFKSLLKSPAFLVGISIFLLVLIAGVILPAVLNLDPFATDGDPFLQPNLEYWLGTNNLGQDVFARLIYGLRSSLYVGLVAGLFATLLGTFIGIYSGYQGGRIDNVLTMATNLLIVIPQLVVLILISNSVETRSLTLTSLFIGATSWVWVARALRAQAASLKGREHIHLARINGFGTFKILLKQILPYVLSYVFMAFILQLTAGIFAEAALSMIGLGPLGTEVVSLGQILNNAQRNEALDSGYWWVFLPATIIITLLSFSLFSLLFNLINLLPLWFNCLSHQL